MECNSVLCKSRSVNLWVCLGLTWLFCYSAQVGLTVNHVHIGHSFVVPSMTFVMKQNLAYAVFTYVKYTQVLCQMLYYLFFLQDLFFLQELLEPSLNCLSKQSVVLTGAA